MGKWVASKENFTPVAVADAANFSDNGYMAVHGGGSTQRVNINELKIGGLAGASAPMQCVLARHSTLGASSLSGAALVAKDPSSIALAAPPVAFAVSTTKPQRDSAAHIMPLGFNAWGGICYLDFGKDPIGILGNAASNGEIGISHLNQGTPGLCDAMMVIEPL